MADAHFYLGDIYPNIFPATTRRQTIPDEEEQKHYEGAKGKVPEVMPSSSRYSVWLGVAAFWSYFFPECLKEITDGKYYSRD